MLVHLRWAGSNAPIASFVYNVKSCYDEHRERDFQLLVHSFLNDPSCNSRSVRVFLVGNNTSQPKQADLTIPWYCSEFFSESMYKSQKRAWKQILDSPNSTITVLVSKHCPQYLAALDMCLNYSDVRAKFDKLPSNYQTDRRVVAAAAARNFSAVRDVVEKYKHDPKVMFAAASCSVHALNELAHSDLLDNAAFMKKSIQLDAHALQYGSTRVKSSKELVLLAVSARSSALMYADINLQDDREVVLAAYLTKNEPTLHVFEAVQHTSEALRNDKELALVAVRRAGRVLQWFSARLKNDIDVVKAAVEACPSAIIFASRQMQVNVDVALVIPASKQGECLHYVLESLRDNREFVFAAVKLDAKSYQHASERLREDKELALLAVLGHCDALFFASPDLRNDRDVVWAAVKAFEHALKFASPAMQNDIDVVKYAISKSYTAIQYASPALRANREVALLALRKSKYAAPYITNKALLNDPELAELLK